MKFLTLLLQSGAGLKAADRGGTSDPYVRISPQEGILANVQNWRGGKAKAGFKSAVMEKTLNPEWNQSVEFLIEDNTASLKLALFDKDRLSKDDPLGYVILNVAELKPGNNELELNVEDGEGKVRLVATIEADAIAYENVATANPGSALLGGGRTAHNVNQNQGSYWGKTSNPDYSLLIAKGNLIVSGSGGNIIQILSLENICIAKFNGQAMSLLHVPGQCFYEMADDRMAQNLQAQGNQNYMAALGLPAFGTAFAQPDPKAEYKLDFFNQNIVRTQAKNMFNAFKMRPGISTAANIIRLGFPERAHRDALSKYLEEHSVPRYLVVKNLGDDPCTAEGMAAIQKRQLARVTAIPILGDILGKTGAGQMMQDMAAKTDRLVASGALSNSPCPSCNTILPATTAFCPSCGTKNPHHLTPEQAAINADAAAAAAPTPGPQQ